MRIAFFGESFVLGTGNPTGLGWVGRLHAAMRQRGHDLTSYNLGIRRETSSELRLRWHDEATRRLLPEHDPRLVFSFGANDTSANQGATRVALAQSIANARAILTAATASFPVLLVGAPPMAAPDQHERIKVLSDAMAGLCAELGVPFLDVCRNLPDAHIWFEEVDQGDGAHPGAAGYARLAGLVEGWAAWQSWFI